MPHQICHAHCPKGGGGTALGTLLALAVLIVIARAVAPAVEHAADDVIRFAVTVLEVLAITVASAAALAGVGHLALLTMRARERQADRAVVVSFQPTELEDSAARSEPLAIEAPTAVMPLTVVAEEPACQEVMR